MAYDTEVNKGSINMGSLARHLTDRESKGWRLQHIFEQHGNTVLIYEKDERLDRIIDLLTAIRTGLAGTPTAAVAPPAPPPAAAPVATPAPAAPPSPAGPPAGWDQPDKTKRRFGR